VSTPKEQWQITDALVSSVEWIEPSRYEGGHYDVVYSYKVGEERYTGEFSDYVSRDNPLHANDIISIRYCPEHPEKSYSPDLQGSTIPRLAVIAVGGAIGLIVFLIALLSGSLSKR